MTPYIPSMGSKLFQRLDNLANNKEHLMKYFSDRSTLHGISIDKCHIGLHSMDLYTSLDFTSDIIRDEWSPGTTATTAEIPMKTPANKWKKNRGYRRPYLEI